MLNKKYSAFVGLHVHFLIHALTTWKKLRFNIFIKQLSLENHETHINAIINIKQKLLLKIKKILNENCMILAHIAHSKFST